GPGGLVGRDTSAVADPVDDIHQSDEEQVAADGRQCEVDADQPQQYGRDDGEHREGVERPVRGCRDGVELDAFDLIKASTASLSGAHQLAPENSARRLTM